MSTKRARSERDEIGSGPASERVLLAQSGVARRASACSRGEMDRSCESGIGSGGAFPRCAEQHKARREADAQATFRTLQGKYPDVLGSHQPLIRRADLGEKGVYYRAMVGPFGTPEEASQFCGSLKTAGGQCVVQRN